MGQNVCHWPTSSRFKRVAWYLQIIIREQAHYWVRPAMVSSKIISLINCVPFLFFSFLLINNFHYPTCSAYTLISDSTWNFNHFGTTKYNLRTLDTNIIMGKLEKKNEKKKKKLREIYCHELWVRKKKQELKSWAKNGIRTWNLRFTGMDVQS